MYSNQSFSLLTILGLGFLLCSAADLPQGFKTEDLLSGQEQTTEMPHTPELEKIHYTNVESPDSSTTHPPSFTTQAIEAENLMSEQEQTTELPHTPELEKIRANVETPADSTTIPPSFTTQAVEAMNEMPPPPEGTTISSHDAVTSAFEQTAKSTDESVILDEEILNQTSEHTEDTEPKIAQKPITATIFGVHPGQFLVAFVTTACCGVIGVSLFGCLRDTNMSSLLKDKLRKMEDEIASMEPRRHQLEKQIENHSREAEILRPRLEQLRISNGQLQTEIDGLNTEKQLRSEKAASLDAQLAELYEKAKAAMGSQTAEQDLTTLQQTQQTIAQMERNLPHLKEQAVEAKHIVEAGKQQVAALDEQLKTARHIHQQLTDEKAALQLECEECQSTVKQQEEQLNELKVKAREVQEHIVASTAEMEMLKTCLDQLQKEESNSEDPAVNMSEQLKTMTDVTTAKLRVEAVEAENKVLSDQLADTQQARAKLESEMNSLSSRMIEIRTAAQNAERRSTESCTRLNVLSEFFQEREAQLQTAIGEKEQRRKHQEVAGVSGEQRLELLERELAVERGELERLTSQLQKVERQLRSELTEQEKKAHDNWLIARSAERKVREAQAETSMLAAKVADLEAETNAVRLAPDFLGGMPPHPPPLPFPPGSGPRLPPPRWNGPHPPPPMFPGPRGVPLPVPPLPHQQRPQAFLPLPPHFAPIRGPPSPLETGKSPPNNTAHPTSQAYQQQQQQANLSMNSYNPPPGHEAHHLPNQLTSRDFVSQSSSAASLPAGASAFSPSLAPPPHRDLSNASLGNFSAHEPRNDSAQSHNSGSNYDASNLYRCTPPSHKSSRPRFV